MKRLEIRRSILTAALLVLLFSLVSCSWGKLSGDSEKEWIRGEPTIAVSGTSADTVAPPTENEDRGAAESTVRSGSVQWVNAERLSRRQIQITWPVSADTETAAYTVKRRAAVNGAGVGDWTVVVTVPLGGQKDGHLMQVTDTLPDDAIHLFEYAVVTDADGQVGATALISNLLVCIDPGHYAGANGVAGSSSYGYAEGDATLRIAKALQTILRERYGIASCLTREDGTISLGGYTNEALDKTHLSLRGAYAGETGSDLFVSLHTNANEDWANGYDTCSQPISINKPILLANTVAARSPTVVAIGNAIGTNLAKVGYEQSVATVSRFRTAQAGQLEQWTDAYNDSLNVPGSLFCRLKENGSEDYYGILRGAAEQNVPGIIIEHGMHTVPEVRKAAMQGDLLQRWAEADANGIAYGCGFVTSLC